MNNTLSKFDPAVDKRLLVSLSGFLWSVIGSALCVAAGRWLMDPAAEYVLWLVLAGVLMALLIHHLGFLKLVNKNIDRILAKEGKVCVFGFQPWKSYMLIMVMVSMGTLLRQSPLPKHYLSTIYIGFGGAMILSSIRYHRIFIKLIREKGHRS